MSSFIISLIVVLFASFIQSSNLILIGDIKPNIIFPLFAVIALFRCDWLARSALIMAAALVLKFTPDPTGLDFIFIAASYFLMILIDHLPWGKIINITGAIIITTISFDLVILNFNVSELSLILYEIMINVSLGLLIFNLAKSANVEELKA